MTAQPAPVLLHRGEVRFCCPAGAVAWPDHCPWHDAWRRVTFLAPPTQPDTQEDDQWQ